MAREVPGGHEIGNHALLQRCMTQMSQAIEACEPGNLRFRCDEISEAQTRIQDLAEGADIQNPLVAIETLQRRQWASDVAKFAVVIVLDDPGAAGAGPGQKGEPPRQRQCDTQRALVRRCRARVARRARATPSNTRRPSASTGIGTSVAS